MTNHLDSFVPTNLIGLLADLALYLLPIVVIGLGYGNVLVIVFYIWTAENRLGLLLKSCALLLHQFATQISEADFFATGTCSYDISYKTIVRSSFATKLF